MPDHEYDSIRYEIIEIPPRGQYIDTNGRVYNNYEYYSMRMGIYKPVDIGIENMNAKL